MIEALQRHGTRFLLAAVLLSTAALPAAAEISAKDPWIAETPPGAAVAAGYVVFANDADQKVDIVGVESPLCERVELHTLDLSEDVARMRKQESLPIPAGGELVLEPGGTHLMLIRPEPLSKGGLVPITFEFSNGQRLSVEAMVKKQGGDGENGHHQHHGH